MKLCQKNLLSAHILAKLKLNKETHKQMNPIDIKATWHKESYDRFLNELLPQLLGERLPLVGYHVESTGPYTCRVTVSVATESGYNAEVTYDNVPQPDEHGLFVVNDEERTVVPRASSEDLDTADILCVGDMLHAMLQIRLGAAPPDLPWDENLLRSWLPLDTWLIERFVGPHKSDGHPYERHFQYVDSTNWLAKRSHIRRLFMDLSDPDRVITPGQLGRLCPYEKPEGPNMGRIGSIAVGATIRDGKLVIEDDAPEAALGLSMSAIPLVEHTDANRLLMGANMMRQWLPYDQPEPALVQSGNEPSAPEFWAGRNMLTAFISWGVDTAEDGIILSESAAARMSNPGEKNAGYRSPNHRIEPGDKLSNRYGMKGVVSAILPDDKMPKLADGTPVELIFSSIGIHSRLNLGQLREAVIGRLAQAEGEPIIAPPFHGPNEEELRSRLGAAGLSEDGMEYLLHGETGQPLPQPSTAGWIYWGRTDHLVIDKLIASSDGQRGIQRQAEPEFQMLHQIGAVETIREHFLLRATIPGENNATATAAHATVERIGHETATFDQTLRFDALQSRLLAAGIAVAQKEDGLHFSLSTSPANGIKLAQPVPHPWLGEHKIESVIDISMGPDNFFPYGLPALFKERGLPNPAHGETLPEYDAVLQANEKLARLQKSQAPESLEEQAFAQLESAIQAYFGVLLTSADVRFDARVNGSGRTVLAPGSGLSFKQMGLADEMAWTLFGPQVTERLGRADEVANRSEQATQVLDEIMAESWILVHRVPTARPTSMIAFQPVRNQDRVARIPTMACLAMDADFDGDQCAIYLPTTKAGQQEAGELLSLAGHLTRDPDILDQLAPYRDPMLGLAMLSLEESGRKQIQKIVGTPVDFGPGYLTRGALIASLKPLIDQHEANHVLTLLDKLTALGFDVAQEPGFSLSPFVSLGLELPPTPPVDRPDLWEIYMQQRMEQLLATEQYDGAWGTYALACKSGALTNNRIGLLSLILVARGVIQDIHGKPVVIPNNFVSGLSPEEHFKTVAGAQAGMRRVVQEWVQAGEPRIAKTQAHSPYVLARARRSTNPGVVFARAAIMKEVDPLVDVESRWFVGIQSPAYSIPNVV